MKFATMWSLKVANIHLGRPRLYDQDALYATTEKTYTTLVARKSYTPYHEVESEVKFQFEMCNLIQQIPLL